MNPPRTIVILFCSLAISIVLFCLQPNRAFAQSPTPTSTLTPTAVPLLTPQTPTSTPTVTPNHSYLPIVLADIVLPPNATTSRYIQTLDPTKLYDQGCAQGTSNPNGIVVLDFGGPRYQNQVYGTKLVGISGFVSITQIADAVKWWMQGFWNCSPSIAQITVGIGTNNCGYIPDVTGCQVNSTNITKGHGQAWAQMVKSVNDWIISSTYASKLTVAGANDIELSWSGPQEVRAWVDGYFANAPNDIFALYNFGACDGCPYLGSQNWVLPNGWTKADVWYVSWGAQTTYPLPEIYLTDGKNASQWYLMGVWSYTNHGTSMKFSGSFTQWQACQDVGLDACRFTANSPSQGWTQLYKVLNEDERTVQPLNWATDITWQQ